MKFHGWQQPFDGRLVNHLVVVLSHHRVTEYLQLLQQSLIVSTGIEFHDEVTALGTNVGGVGAGLHQNTHLLRMIGVCRILEI